MNKYYKINDESAFKTIRQGLAIAVIMFVFLGAAAFESYESKRIKYHLENRDTVSKRMQVFEACMNRNNYDYTDALCTVCYDSAVAIIPYSKVEIKQFKKDYRAYRKWAKRKAIEPMSENDFINKP